jgi:uncharacterized protein (TIRG00374 family)
VSLAEVRHHLGSARVGPFVVAVLVATATFPLRTARWRYLLRLEGEELPLWPLWHATAIGFMANNLLPARAGEFARAFAASRLTGVRFTAAIASIAVERIMDGIAIVALMFVAIAAGAFSPSATIGGVSIIRITSGAAVFLGVALVGAVIVVRRPVRGIQLARAVFKRVLPAALAEKAVRAVEGMLAGLDALRSPARLAAVAIWSLAVWLTYAVSFVLCFVAFGIEIHWTAAFTLQGLISFGVSIPSTPGFFGPFEAATRAGLALYGVGPGQAVSYAVAYHLGTFLPISVLGLWSLSRAHLHLADLRRGRSQP